MTEPIDESSSSEKKEAIDAESADALIKTNNEQTSAPTDGMKTGKCKWFNGSKGWGFVTLDDGGQDVFVHQSILKMTGFRQLNEEEAVEIQCKTTDKGLEAIKVTGPNGQDCKGSSVRHQARRKYRKMRCYNCGEFQNHIASRCSQPPQPKRCHQCKSESHLVADCPIRQESVSSDGKKSSKNRSTKPSSSASSTHSSSTSTTAPTTADEQQLPSNLENLTIKE